MRTAQAQNVTQGDVDQFVEGLPTSEFFGQNLSTDQAVSALEYIFGDIINVVAGAPAAGPLGTPDTPLAAMIGMMNTGLLFLGGVYLAWVALVGTLYTADKGEILGGRWSVVWMPLKTTLGISAIFPAVYGYSWLQFFVFWVLLQGIGLGNAVMNKGFDMFKDNREFAHIQAVPPDLIATGYDLLRSSYCTQAFNQLGPDAVAAMLRSYDVPEPPQRTNNGVIFYDADYRENIEDRERERETQRKIQAAVNKINTHPVLRKLPRGVVTGTLQSAGGLRNLVLEAGDNIDDVLDSMADTLASAFKGGGEQPGSGPILTMNLIPVDGGTNEQELVKKGVSGEVYKTVHYFWGTPHAGSKAAIEAVNDGKVNSTARKDYCGHLEYKRIVGYHMSRTQNVENTIAVGEYVNTEVTTKEELKGDDLKRAQIKQQEAADMYGLSGDGQDIPIQEFAALDVWVKAIHKIGTNLAQYHSYYPQNVPNFGQHERGDGAPTEEQLNNTINDFINATKLYAETRSKIDQLYLDTFVTAREQSLEEYYWQTFTANLERDGFLAFGSYYVELAEARENARKRLTPTVEFERTDPDAWKSFQLYRDRGDIRIAALSDDQALGLFRYFKGYQDFNNQMQTYTGVMDVGSLVPGTEGYSNQSYQGRRDRAVAEETSVLDEYEDDDLGELIDALSGAFQVFVEHYIGTGKLQSLEGPPPLLRIREMGQDFLSLSGWALGVGSGSALALGLPAVLGVGGSFIGGMFSGVLSGATAFLFTVALWLFLLGGFLAVYLPMVPFLVWVGAVIGYFLLAIESIIAAPLWAIAFMEPGAQDGPGGKNAQGWYLVMNLFLRPVLLVVSMIAVMLLADVVLRYLNIYMLPTFEMATAADSSFTKFLTFVWTTIIYCVFMMTTMHGVYSLIHRIPDNIMEWLGVGIRGLGDTSDEREVRGLVMSTVQRARAPSAHSLRSMGAGRQRDKGARSPDNQGGPEITTKE